MRVIAATLTAIALGSFLSTPAYAFKCSPTTDGRFTQVWMSRCIPFSLSTNGTLFDSDEQQLLVQQSFQVWSNEACTDLEFKYMGTTDGDEGFQVGAPFEQTNIIISIEDESHLTRFDDERLLALTLTRYSVATGEILDADILLNSVRFTFDNTEDMAACRSAFDLRNTLVHEIGHFIGFDHVTIRSATMYAEADTCETLKRDLDTDDREGVCSVYATGQAARTCTPPPSYTPDNGLDPEPFRNQCTRDTTTEEPGGCSCTTSPEKQASLGWLIALAALVFSGRRTSALLRRS